MRRLFNDAGESACSPSPPLAWIILQVLASIVGACYCANCQGRWRLVQWGLAGLTCPPQTAPLHVLHWRTIIVT